MAPAQPKVTVLTPVYNGEEYFVECLESVLRQTYENFEYVIVNNCSTDRSLEIATRYADRDPRVRIVNNTTFVGVIENHNIAFSHVAPDAKYCKIVSADDWIYPECLERTVDLAERNPSVGLVSYYSITNAGVVRQAEMPLDRDVFPGRDVARIHMLGTDVLGAPTSSLYRADLVRAAQPFFSVALPSADVHASFAILKDHDFGFVHQVLCFERWHAASVTSKLVRFNSFLVDRIDFVTTYGRFFFTPDEQRGRLAQLFAKYYDFLADQTIHRAGADFWAYQHERMGALGHSIDNGRLRRLVALRALDWVGNPKRTIEKILSRFGE